VPEAVKWGAGREAAFVAYLDYELTQARQARLGLDRQHAAWLDQYRTSAKPATKRFPFEGAANWTLPLTAIDVDVLYARFMQTVHAPPNLWTVSPLNERWTDAAKPVQDFLQLLDERLLRMYNVNKRVFLETTKLGTGIYKTGWKYGQQRVMGYDAAGRRERQIRVTSAPFVDHVRLANFVLPASAYAIQPDDQGGAPWVAERHRLSLGALRAWAFGHAPFLPDVRQSDFDMIARFVEADRPPADVKLQELDFNRSGAATSATALDGDDFDRDTERGTPGGAALEAAREVELWEVHARFPTQSSGDTDDDVVAWYHPPTRRLVRAVYAPYDHGARPYDAIRYFPGDGFFGIGVCEQKEMFQTLGSEMFNFTMDNVLLVNSRMIVAKSSANIAPGEPIYPNKVWITDGDVRQDFGMFPMADIYPSLPMLQSGIMQLGEKRTGVSDAQIGNLDALPGRTPATTMMSLLQEGSRRPDLTIKDMRAEGLSIVGLRILQLCQQFVSSPVDYDGKRWLNIAVTALGMPEGAEVAQKLMTPMEPVEFGIGVSLTATSGSANKEVERQGALALLQLAGTVGPQFIQLVQVAMQAQGTPLAEVALNAAADMQKLYKRVQEQFDVRDIEPILPAQIEQQMQMQALMGMMMGGQPGADGAPGGQSGGAPPGGDPFGGGGV
jgi:hypothetical protein